MGAREGRLTHFIRLWILPPPSDFVPESKRSIRSFVGGIVLEAARELLDAIGDEGIDKLTLAEPAFLGAAPIMRSLSDSKRQRHFLSNPDSGRLTPSDDQD